MLIEGWKQLVDIVSNWYQCYVQTGARPSILSVIP